MQTLKTPLAGGEAGISVTEFLICAPFALLLLYVCMDLNRRIETRTEVEIAGRNLAASLTGAEAPDVALAGAQRDISGDWTAVAITVAKPNAAAHAFAGKTFTGGGAAGNGERARPADGGPFETVSRVSGQIAEHGTTAIDGVKNFSIGGQSLFIPDETEAIELTVRSAVDSSPFRRAMVSLSAAVETRLAAPAANANQSALDADDERRFGGRDITAGFARGASGYYPTSYKYQGMLGMLVGKVSANEKQWGTGNDDYFVDDCMMSFSAKSNCKPMSWNAATLRVAYVVVAVVKCIVSAGAKCVDGSLSGEKAAGVKDAGNLLSGDGSAVLGRLGGAVTERMNNLGSGATGSIPEDFDASPFASGVRQIGVDHSRRLQQEIDPSRVSSMLRN